MNSTDNKPRWRHFFSSWALDILVSVLLVAITILSSYTPGWPFVVAVSILGLALLSFLRSRPLSKREKKLRHHLAHADEFSSKHQLFADYLTEEITYFERALERLGQGNYEATVDDIPDSSIQCIKNLKQSGFVVYVTDSKSDYYTSAKGREYLNVCYEVAENSTVSFTRLFVIENYESMTEELLRLMQDHITHNINVLVAERQELDGIVPEDLAIDFGLFDDRILMKFSKEETRSARLEVHFEDSEVYRYRKLRDRLLNLRSHNKFMSDLYLPVNAEAWSAILSKSLTLKIPYGLSENDAQMIVKEALGSRGGNSARVLVLGLTPRLIDALNEAGADVWCVDQANIAPRGVKPKQHLVGNWLDITIAQSFDAVVSDEGLNNLSMLQLRPFFQNMYNHLKDGGRMVMRVMCRVPGWERLVSLSSSEALAMVKATDERTREQDIAGKLLRLLHCEVFGFSPRTSAVDPAAWNRHMENWLKQGQIQPDAYERWTFPYVLRLISPTVSVLAELPRGLFIASNFMNVDEGYCPIGGELAPFYRIASWIKTERAANHGMHRIANKSGSR